MAGRCRPAAASALACLLLWSASCGKPTGSASRSLAARPPAAVQVATVAYRPMERTLTALGTLRAMDQASLSIKTTGRLKSLKVDVGSVVRAGEVLAQVEPRDYELRVQQSAALLAQARARLGLPLDGDSDDVEPETVSTVREARALFDEARSNRERIRTLETERILSPAERERAEAEFEVTQNRYIDALQDINERRAVLAQRRAEFEIARQQLADTELRAPFDGAVQERLTNVGEFLVSGTPVLTLVRRDPLRLQADIPERDAHRVRSGQNVRMTLEGDTNVYTGRLARISPALDERTRMLRVEAEFPNPGQLRPGRFARVEVVVEDATPALTIPADTLVRFAGTEKALVVVSNTASERILAIGRRQGPWIEVLQGLHAGELVIRSPEGLQTGDPVVPEGAGPKPAS